MFMGKIVYLRWSLNFSDPPLSHTLLKWRWGRIEEPEGFPGGSDGYESACNAEDPGSILGCGRFPGEGSGNPLQYSRLENSMDRGVWRATVHGVPKSWT